TFWAPRESEQRRHRLALHRDADDVALLLGARARAALQRDLPVVGAQDPTIGVADVELDAIERDLDVALVGHPLVERELAAEQRAGDLLERGDEALLVFDGTVLRVPRVARLRHAIERRLQLRVALRAV